MATEAEIKQRFSRLEVWLDERMRRLWAAAESAALGRGGISLMARASGISRRAIAVGLAELQKKPDRSRRARLPIRQKGGGRKKASLKDPDLLRDLKKLLEPVTRGDPQSPLRWTCKSVRKLAEELRAQGHQVTNHRLEGGGSGNGLKGPVPAKAGRMDPAPSGLQEVDGLNHLLGNLRLDRCSVQRCTSQSS